VKLFGFGIIDGYDETPVVFNLLSVSKSVFEAGNYYCGAMFANDIDLPDGGYKC
jgi:hypothetical protein